MLSVIVHGHIIFLLVGEIIILYIKWIVKKKNIEIHNIDVKYIVKSKYNIGMIEVSLSETNLIIIDFI